MNILYFHWHQRIHFQTFITNLFYNKSYFEENFYHIYVLVNFSVKYPTCLTNINCITFPTLDRNTVFFPKLSMEFILLANKLPKELEILNEIFMFSKQFWHSINSKTNLLSSLFVRYIQNKIYLNVIYLCYLKFG